jgi:hypothetical protein
MRQCVPLEEEHLEILNCFSNAFLKQVLKYLNTDSNSTMAEFQKLHMLLI